MPITFAADITGHSQRLVLYSPLDEKPKTVDDPRTLARVRDILARPAVTVLVDRWSEDWTHLAWLRLGGTATLLEPGGEAGDSEHTHAVALLRSRYDQYGDHALEARPILRIEVERVVTWAAQAR